MRRLALWIAWTLLLSCSAAYADPIVVTGGSVSRVYVGANAPISLQGAGLSLTGAGYESFIGPASCNPCLVGGPPITFNATIDSFVHTAPAPGMVGGNSFSDVFLDGRMSFFGPSFPVSLAASNLSLNAPFTFFATLRGFSNSSLSGTPLFNDVFVGQGIATARYSVTKGPGATLVTSVDVNYQFAPTPEPASALLLLTGVAAVAMRSRRGGSAPRA
jgi:hypothetical protein